MNDKYTLECRVNGKNIHQISHDGKFFIEGRSGTEYTLKVSNNTNKRVMAIVSVDGINVIDGAEASEKTTGYIIQPYSVVEVKGFRESDTHVGAFKFVTKDGSYAKEVTGSTKNCGVIGCMIMQEKEIPQPLIIKEIIKEKEPYPIFVKPWRYNEPYWGDPYYTWCGGSGGGSGGSYTCNVSNSTLGSPQSDGASTSANSNMRTPGVSINEFDYALKQSTEAGEFDLGSTWGQKLYDKVDTIEFERGKLVKIITLYYGSKVCLEALGVPVIQKKTISSLPEAFPARFCKAPKYYS